MSDPKNNKHDRTPRRRGVRILLRVLEFSPVVAAVLLAAVWFGVPTELRLAMTHSGTWRSSAAGMVFEEAPQTEGTGWVPTPQPAPANPLKTARDYYGVLRVAKWESRSPAREFPGVAERVADSLADSAEAFYEPDGSPKPFALPRTDRAYSALRKWAASWEATPYVFLLPDPPQPSVVASAVGRPAFLPTDEELGYYSATSVADWVWNQHGTNEHLAYLGGWGSQWTDANYTRMWTTEVGQISGECWLFITVTEASEIELVPYDSMWPITEQDPRSAEYQSMLPSMARRAAANVWVVGPIVSHAVPQLVPEGMAAKQAERFGDTVMTNSGGALANLQWDPEVAEAPDSEKSLVPRLKYEVLALTAGTDDSPEGSRAPQMILCVATWAENPRPPLKRGWFAKALDELRVWHAVNQSGLLVASFVFLGLTLVASPVAFVLDRRMTERERVATEMERVQRDAHDRVYNRLAALSMRLEAEAAGAADDSSSTALTAAAEDLTETSRDLREILGDARLSSVETAAAAADPGALMVEQLSALASAQQALTGARIEISADPTLPPLAPEAGWDLQCITEEAIANAVRHGHASSVRVVLKGDAAGVTLEIADNGTAGRPIDLDSLPETSTGIRGMQARVERLGGSLDVVSGEAGTSVVARIPAARNGRIR